MDNHRSRLGFFLALGLAGFGLAVWFVSLGIIRSKRQRNDVREGERRFTLESVEKAIAQYHAERGAYPPGDGAGSSALAKALGERSAKGMPYIEYTVVSIERDGQLWVPGGGLIRYKCPGNHGPYDLWTDP